MFSDVSASLAAAFVGSLGLYFLLRFLLRDRAASALITAVCAVFFFSYGVFFDFMTGLEFPATDRYLLPVFFIIEVLAVAAIFKARKKSFALKIAPVLNTIAAALVILSLSNILFFTAKENFREAKTDVLQTQSTASTSTKTDIYYIIMDEYFRPDKMKEVFGYDNSEFTGTLKRLGFFIAEKSESKAGSTLFSLASSLNMEHILPPEYDLATAMRLIQDSKVGSFLKSQGYKTVIFNNSNSTTGKAIADYDFAYDGADDAQKLNFSNIIIKNSQAKQLFSAPEKEGNPVFKLSRATTLFTLEKILDIDEVPSPKFVFAHFVSPHLPFVFNRKGGMVDPAHEDDWEDKKYYLDQYIFMSSQIHKIAAELIEKNKNNPPIIIIQSDHGIRKNYLWEGKIKSISYIATDMWKYIFNAYYLPGYTGTIPEDITPIDTFRLVLGNYFKHL